MSITKKIIPIFILLFCLLIIITSVFSIMNYMISMQFEVHDAKILYGNREDIILREHELSDLIKYNIIIIIFGFIVFCENIYYFFKSRKKA